MKNTGKRSEAEFERRWKARGKLAFLYRFEDQADLHGLNDKLILSRAKPCDFILVETGFVSFCEVKSSSDKTAFRFSLIKEKQQGFAKMIAAAGGKYSVYVHRLEKDEWFKIEWTEIQAVLNSGGKSIPWKRMQENWPWNT